MAVEVPFRQFVLKVASRCDLACDHCYVYEGADTSWRDKPKTAGIDTLRQTAVRIAEHAAANSLPAVLVVLHGGEPLLAGRERLGAAAAALRKAVESVGTVLDLRIQTNGMRFDPAFGDLFREYGVRVGVSLDGDRAANDRHRRFAGGASSHDRVLRALDLLRTEYPDLYAGILCTLDVRNDPAAVYEAIKAAEPPRADFLLPHATHAAPPVRAQGAHGAQGTHGAQGAGADYGDWLLAVYDLWVRDGRPFRVRTFDSVLGGLRGLPSSTEALGLEPVDVVVVEADGTVEQTDSLKAAYAGAPETGFDVFRHSFDEVARHPGFTARQRGLAGLCRTCRSCAVVDVCGGGLRTHRYRAADGPVPRQADPFDNPSVYCSDLKELIMGIKNRGRIEVAPRVPAQASPADARRPAQPPTPAQTHRLPAAVVDELAHGFGGAEAVAHLGEFQRSLRRLLLAKVFVAAEAADAGAHREGILGAIEQLKHLDATAPEALRDVLAHPYVRVWALRCLEHADAGRVRAADLGHLAAIAAATALRAGVDAEVDVPILDGAVHLPTLGRLLIGADRTGPQAMRRRHSSNGPFPGTSRIGGGRSLSSASWVGAADWPSGTVRLRIADGACSLLSAPGWQGIRRIALPGFATGGVALEDTDPYRDCQHWDVTGRLSDRAAWGWHRTVPAAWEILRRDHAAYAPGLAAGLTTIVPLVRSLSGRDVSATARHAHGSIGAALPVPGPGRTESDPVVVTLLLIHEFQHTKLGAVLDMADLHDPADPRLYPAPWREDARPLEGLLQGTYAHVAVTDFWRVRRSTAARDADRVRAGVEFERWLAHTVRSCRTLAGSGSLTPLGLRFVEAMQETLDPWLSELVQGPDLGHGLRHGAGPSRRLDLRLDR